MSNRTCKSSLLAAALILASAASLPADSRFGAAHLGVPVNPGDARSRAMGGVSAAIGGEDFSLTNPARTVNFWRAGFNGTLAQDYRTLKDGGKKYGLRSTEFLGFRGIYPSYNRFVVGWGIYQWRDLSWEYSDTIQVAIIPNPIDREVSSNGAIYVSSFTIARPIGGHMALGFGLDWMIGRATSRRSLDFANVAYVNNRESFKEKYSFFRPSFGYYASFHNANLGFSIVPSHSAQVNRELIFREGSIFNQRGIRETYELDYPMVWRLGASYNFHNRFVVAGDMEFEGWKGSNLQLTSPVTADDQWRYCLGFELLTDRTEDKPWYRKLPLRLGYSYTVYPFRIASAAVTESTFSMGTGSYFGANNGLLDLAFEFVSRSADSPVYPQESVFRVVASVSAFEKWVRRPRRE